ncbi:Hsp33 family molecular chaperone HslO [Ureibacillus sp. FSL K6-8385]|uniref:33 kDa chaperonin n=1 Tax=Ureibacillus terrenus TaxID=118246 RepID=A0A540UY86_9BACL|nr:Hsp33 family molecular chaperone HslO [Ureibacillus terrenus]MED3662421.1 Hsp33 family molecular chaperone HslO [Ureibacillus terrenus]MED3763189.1 Hsp33 family molecular chaperone HslO [Ureibacillus terrenus]TQE89460.1 Hsp33 family molecular chaperone HslO [Ureibacillus terrenus]
MEDYLVKALAFDGKIRAYAARSTNTVGEAQKRHDTWPTATAALGRALTAGVMMGSMMNQDDKITIKIEGGGPIGIVLIDANGKGEVRGYVTNPHIHFPLNEAGKLDVRRAVGTQGSITIVKDLGVREMFSGQTPIVSGEIAEDFTYYYAASEQIPSSVGLGVLVNTDNSVLAAGGFIIQVMPGCDEETIEAIETRLKTVEPISKMIEKGYTPEQILEAVLGEGNVKVLETMPIQFKCNCSKERFGAAIQSLGIQEIQEMIDEDGGAEAQCHFCMEKYYFSKEELEGFIREIQAKNESK